MGEKVEGIKAFEGMMDFGNREVFVVVARAMLMQGMNIICAICGTSKKTLWLGPDHSLRQRVSNMERAKQVLQEIDKL